MDHSPSTSRGASTHAPERLATHIWIGVLSLFGVLATSVGLCIFALVVSDRAVAEMRSLATAERHAVAIGVAAREQYMHETHGALLADPEHVGHEHHWGAMLRSHVQSLRPLVDANEQAELDRIEARSDDLSRIFSMDVIPAATEHDDARLRRAHGSAEQLVREMIGTSDASVATLSRRAQDAMAVATDTVGYASAAAVLATFAAAIVAFVVAVGFVRRIATPVAALERAATRIGQGDFDADAGPTGIRELETLRRRFREMATQLREREARLLQAERLASLGSLAAGVAHELNNPLGVVLGYLKILRRNAAAAPFADELRMIDEEAHQCRRIVEDLVTFAREPRLSRAEVDLAALVRDVCARMQTVDELDERTVEVEASAPVIAEIDDARIGQVLRNLLLNAASASDADATIHVEVDAHDAHARVIVRDEGKGIAPEDLPHVFEPFYSRRPGGTGLGLAVCHGIVRAHGGTIELESGPGRVGTTVIVTLPRASSTRAARELPSADAPA